MNHDDFLEHGDLVDDHLAERLSTLASALEPGEWSYRRSATDGALILYAGGEPIAHLYGGIDLAKYLVEVSPPRLLDGFRP